MPPQRDCNLNISCKDPIPPINVTVTGAIGATGATGVQGAPGPPGPQGGMTGIGYEPLPSTTYNEFTPGIKTFQVPNESTNAFISGMYIRIRDVTYPDWFMNGTIISYTGTTMKVDVDSVTFGKEIDSCKPCGTHGTVGYCNTTSTTPCGTQGTTGHMATSLTPCNDFTTYISYSRNEFVDANQIFVIENAPEGIFSSGLEVRVTDYFYPSWYMDATVIGYIDDKLSLDIDSVQFGAGEIINELTSDTSLKFEIGIKDFLIENTTKIVAFSKDTSVRITTPDICIGTYMNGNVISFIGNILKVRIDTVTTVSGFNLYTGFVCDWCIQSLVNNDKYSGNNWRISIRNTRGLLSTTRVTFSNGEKALNITDGTIDNFNISRGIRITDNTYPNYYMDGIILGYTGTTGYTGATGTSILVGVENTNRSTPQTVVYKLTSTSTHSFSRSLKTFVVSMIKTISAIGVGSAVKIFPFNAPIESEMTGIVVSYIGTNLLVNVTNVTSNSTIYPNNLSSWNIEALPVNSILSGSDWFMTLHNPTGTRSDTRNLISVSQVAKTFIIQDGSINSFTTIGRLRVIDRTYPSFYMEGIVSSLTYPNLSLLIDYIKIGSRNTTIIGELSSISSHKFETGQKNFVVQDLKKLHAFTKDALVSLKAKNLWIGITLRGTVISYIGTNLLINITAIDRPATNAGFDDYTDFVNNWTIEIDGFSPGPSGSDWVIVNAPIVTLGVPTNVTAITGDTEVVVNWTSPVNTDGITKYRIISTPPLLSGSPSRDTTGTITSLVFTGLTNGTNYTFRVQAIGYADAILGTLSNPSSNVTPRFGPRILNVTAGDGAVRVNWKLPSTLGTIAKYRIISIPSPTSGLSQRDVLGASVTSFDFTNLTNGTPYTFRIRAVDASDVFIGELSDPSISVIPIAGPSFLTVIPGNASAIITWTLPSTTTGITRYSVTGTPVSNLP